MTERPSVRRLRRLAAVSRHRMAGRRSPGALFVKIPKTAGTTIYAALYRRGLARVDVEQLRGGTLPVPRFVTFGHATLAGLAAEGLVRESDFDDSFRFTFVRNPYDRAVSLHYHMRHHRHIPMVEETTSFTAFLESVAANHPSPGAYESEGLSLASPQLMWFESTGRVDYVGRTERLHADLDRLCDLLGVRRVAIPMVNRKPNRVERNYRDAYDEHTRRLVEQIYGADIDQFGYEF